MKRIIILIYLNLFLGLIPLSAQITSGVVPSFIPPSPNAAALGKFGEVSVNYNAGSINQNISLLSLSEQDLKLNIGASYYYTGFRPNEEFGSMGLGWSLQAGGVITRTINGLSDEGINGYLSVGSSLGANITTQQSYDIAHQVQDGQPDMFSFNFMGYSGKFFFGNDGQIHFVNQRKLKISYEIDNLQSYVPNNIITRFTVVGEDGVKYIFDAKEYTNAQGTGVSGHFLDFKVTSWYLSKIIGLKGEEINFTYTQQPISKKRIQGSYSDKRVIIPNQSSIGLVANKFYTVETYLSKITGSLWEIAFDYTEKTKNVFGYTSYFKSLDRIRLLDKTQSPSALVKSYEMTYVDSYYSYIVDRFLLRSIQEKSAGGVLQTPYWFVYQEEGYNPNQFQMNIDYWGYYNGSYNGTLLPDLGADREPDYVYARIFSLSNISYPTGGYLAIQTEANDISYLQGQPYQEIKKETEYYTFVWSYINDEWVVTQDNSITIDNNSTYSSYMTVEFDELDLNPIHCKEKVDVSLPASSVAYTAAYFKPSHQCLSELDATNGQLEVHVSLVRYTPIGIGTAQPKKTVGGLRVKGYFTHSGDQPNNYTTITYDKVGEVGASSGSLNNSFRTKFDITGQTINDTPFAGALLYSAPISPMALSPIQYSEVKEVKNHGQNTQYYFTGYEDGIFDDYGDIYASSGGVNGINEPSLFGPADSFDYLRGNAKKTAYYNGAAITQKDTNTYQSKEALINESNYYKAWAFYPEILFVESGGGYSSTPYTHYIFKRYNLSSTFPRQLAQEKTTYSPTGLSPVKEKQEFVYNTTSHLQRIGVKSYESDGSYHEIQTKYPLDYLGVFGLHSSIQAMIDSNYVSYPLEIKDTYYKNGVGTLVDAGVNTYQLVSGTGWRPQMILPYKTFGFTQYGNASGFTTYSGTSNEINGSSYREFLHYVLFDNRGNIEHLRHKQSTDYAYLWGYQNQNALAVVQNATPTLVNTALGSIGSSRAALQSLTSPSSLQSTLTSLQSSSTLASAQMAFYTYHPVFGQVSQTSPNGLSTYYAYDGFGRLEQVRDHENNLRKQIGYYYRNDGLTRSITGINSLKNAIVQSSFRVAGASAADVSDEIKSSTEISYFDQLGGLEQRLGYRNSPLKKDIAFEKVYLDSLSRVIKTVLPVPLSTNTGANEISVNYYADGFYSDNATNEVLSFDNSKLGRPLVQVGAGAAWRSPTLKATTFAYESAGADIPVYEVNGASGLAKTGAYPANSLYKSKVTDPQGNTQTEIKDLQGRVIEKIGALGDTTHYVYDMSHNLRAVIQPEAMKNASFTASDLEKGVFYTNYDTKNRPKEKYVPSGGWTRYIYDKLDRVVLEQHAEQALQNKWSFTKYDVLGRVIQRGELVNSGTQSSLQSAFDGVNTPYEVWQGTAYSSQSFPIAYNATDIKNELYYDQYAWVNSALAFNDALAYHSQYSNVKGLATGSYARSPENVNEVFHTVLYYDNKGQVIQSHQTHHKGGSNLFTKPIITNFQYSFVGEVLAAKITYQVDGQSTISTLTTNEYDHAGRLLKVYHGINGIAPVEILRMTYDEIGRLSQKKILPNGSYYVGGTLDYINRPPSPNANIDDVAKKAVCLLPGTLVNGSSVGHYSASINPNAANGTAISGLQTIDYQYHIRGGLRGINLDASGNLVPKASEGDLFSLKLDYESAGYYDGNIGKQTWQNTNVSTNSPLGQRAYAYSYNSASFLKSALYSGIGTEDFSLPNINYDKNGNITNLQRKGKNGANYELIDNLSYGYIGNRSVAVSDDINDNEDVGDFRDINNGTGSDYTFWANGSLKSDANKGISLITYDTFLKKVKQVDFSSGSWVKWFYDGSGTLYKRTNSAGDVWEYLPNGLIFKNGVPYSLNVPDGRAVYVAGQWIYEFEYRDHQSNLRVAFKADGNQLVQTQTNETDPWGMVLKPLSTLAGSNPQKFDFVNRERDDDFGLNIMHLGARMYDPVVPRFWQTEPLTEGQENWSVYQYGYNNPIRFNDANGLSSEECCQDAVDFVAGMVLTMVDNNSPIPTNFAGNENRGSAYEAGRKAGNYLSLATGTAQIILGAGGNTIAGAGTLATAGAGTPVTAPLSMASTTTMANGAATMAKALNNLNSEGQKSASTGSRAGKPFTPKEKQKVIDANKEKNNGKVLCENCGVETTQPKKSEKGVTPPKTDRQIDHRKPKSKGGSGTADNGDVLCRDCNRKKSDN